MRDLLPNAPMLLSAGGDTPLSQLLLQALLTLQPQCKMRVADFSGVYVSGTCANKYYVDLVTVSYVQ